MRFSATLLLALALGLAGLGEQPGRAAAASSPRAELKFTDAHRQTAELIGYERTITLTPQQEAVKREALAAMHAPCCNDRPLSTCCCPCNLAKSTWGLANYMIARQGAGVEQVRRKVGEWLRFIAPAGFRGDTCYVGACGKPFAQGGCGGMAPPTVF